MIQLPAGFDLSLFVSEIMTFGVTIVAVALAFGVFHLIMRVLQEARA